MSHPVAYPVGKVPVASGDYTTGLCECCAYEGDLKICCATYFCMPCMVSQNMANLHGYNYHCCDYCCVCTHAPFFGFTYFTRLAVRHTYQMPEDHCGACCLSWCCMPCGRCQDAREIKYRTGRAWGYRICLFI
eukprot:EC719316.1.p2 GENE.EC719316.1~~EC719316.1.p2  ORF type:complete len:146 (+),score=20.44 EC719316.1:42-440(+)